ncbi:4'-phosphopantetheinyl transferase superfamily protein [Luteibacter sp. 3190]|uniref:4'-phosphopantetheinyl transferase family protein n=1 Tax=Luteibacter sp. 3190 TaxID=2817736 RepID=UPI002863B475|nr:4'-phosphopantetheinyl transferase superfamily protein [Luteibacter sp. 3190]MDR6935787.1 enterobactin synthetase component D [Luteibacter sp. 3190]
MAETDNGGAWRRIPLGEGRPALPDAFALAFDVAAFELADFDRYGIALPPSIERSVPKRQAEYIAGRRVALAALKAAGSDATDIAIAPDRAPAWPRGFLGSLSHTDDVAVAVAARAGGDLSGIGIDIERQIAPAVLDSVRELVIDRGERDSLARAAASLGWPVVLTLAFSAKESFYKATAASVGRFFDFAALRILALSPEARVIEAEVAAPLSARFDVGRRVTLSWTPLDERTWLTSFAW